MKKSLLSAVLFSLFISFSVNAQVDEEKTGAWYMYFWNTNFGESEWGLQGDIQYRIYQEALLPHKLSNRFYLTHRFRYEQRWVENQDFRTRYRYNLFLNVPLNQPNLNKNAVYLALYNEIFINGEREIGDGRSVELFDRNRFYSALGYALKDNLKLQAGYMTQITNTVSKGQIQLSLHHTF